MVKAQNVSIIPIESIAQKIYLIRDQKVMLDTDLAALYGVTTGNLNKAVKRNPRRFPDDFMIQLTPEEFESLKFQIGIPNTTGRGGRRSPPYAFTEQGVAMLSSILHSNRAADINVAIMRTFVRMREVLATDKDLARKVEKHDHDIAVLYDYIKKVLGPPTTKKKPIGYIWPEEKE